MSPATTLAKALNTALDDALAADPDVVLIGEFDGRAKAHLVAR